MPKANTPHGESEAGLLSRDLVVLGSKLTSARDSAERSSVERDGSEARGQFWEVFAHAPFGVCVSGLNGRFLQVNEAFCRMLGYSEQELIGKAFAELTHPDDLKTSFQMQERIYQDPNQCVEVEKRYIHRTGRLVWVRIRVSMVRDSDGRPSYHVVHVEDITERKRTEAALRESENRFRIMADSCPTIMWVTDADGQIQFINRAFREFGGNTHDLVEGDKWFSKLHPDDAREYIAATERAVREQSPFRAEARFRRWDGAWRWMASYAEPRSSPEGEFLGHGGVSLDITDRKESEQARQFQLSLIRAIHEVSLDGILVVNAEGLVVSLNKRFLEVWKIFESGATDNLPMDVIGSPDRPLLNAVRKRLKDPDLFMKRVRELYDHPDEDDHCEIELADGRTLERYSTQLRTDLGHYLGRVWFFRDISGRKQSEEALRSSEEKFRQLTENIREVFWMMEPGTNEILYVSPAYEQVWGRSCDSLYRDFGSCLESVHPEDKGLALLSLAPESKERPVEAEFRIRTPDGVEKWIRNRAFPIRGEGGELVRMVGLAEEITDQKRYEAELIRSREGADSRSRVLEKINRREPLGDVMEAASEFLKHHFHDSDCCIHLRASRDFLELVPQSCTSPELLSRLSRVAIAAREEICARAACDSECKVDGPPHAAYAWPVLDPKGQILATISVFPRSGELPESYPRILDLTGQLVALAINDRRFYDGLTHLSQHDSLTGLANRVFLDQHLARCLEPGCGIISRLAIAYIDLDGFKEVNDLYGHAAGDTFLQIAASRFRSVLREGDLLARIGGDEFIAVLGGVFDREEAKNRGLRLLESLEDPLAITKSLKLACTASIGVALFPEDAQTIEDLKRRADEAMYVAKTAGKNRVRVCDPSSRADRKT